MKKPKITTKCPANYFAHPTERIVEYSGGFENRIGGLISFRNTPDGGLEIFLYRHNKKVKITVGKGE